MFTITVDNASANGVAISYLSKKLNNWDKKGCILDGKYLHMRCCAHIINLIVCEGLREAHDSIVSIRNAVKYVKSSPSRLQKFKECASHEKIECKSIVFLDVPTRWNSTYIMQKTTCSYKKVFEKYNECEYAFILDLGDDVPNFLNWPSFKQLVNFYSTFMI